MTEGWMLFLLLVLLALLVIVGLIDRARRSREDERQCPPSGPDRTLPPH